MSPFRPAFWSRPSRARTCCLLALCGVILCATSYYLGLATGQLSAFDAVAYPLASLALAGMALAFYLRPDNTRALSVLLFVGTVAHALSKFVMVLYLNDYLNDATLAAGGTFGFTYWFPTFYALGLFALHGERGVIAVMTLFMAVVTLSLPAVLQHLQGGNPDGAVRTLVELYLSNGALMMIMVIVSRRVATSNALQERAAMLEAFAYTDALTNLPNRRYLGEVLEEETARANRYARPFSLLLLDLDNFKAINDRHGHEGGDRVLQMFARLLSDEVRTADHLGRWGGEEFLILAPETPLETAQQLAERIRLRTERARFPIPEPVTVSIGVAPAHPDDSVRTIVKRADEALYRAKTQGKNRVTP